MAEDPGITLERLAQLRKPTSQIATALERELRTHLDALASLLRPKSLLGDFISGASAESRPGAEKAFKALSELYDRVAPRPFRLSPGLSKPIPAIRVQLDLHPLEEEVVSSGGGQQITVVSPFAWVLSYPGACSLGSLRKMLKGQKTRDEVEIQQFALNSCILHLLLERSPKLVALLTALRFGLETTSLSGLGELPVPVIRSVVPSTRPPAQVMLDAANLAGLSSFSEVIDVTATRGLEDPLKARLEAALAEHGLA